MYSKTCIDEMPCAVLRRSSSKAQGTSISNQGRTVDSVIEQYKLHVIKEFILHGVSGSIPGNRSDIDEIIELMKTLGLKRLVLLVPDHTCFTRAGAGHGGHPETHELIRTFGKNPKTGVPAHYIKQKNEKVALCPGAPEAMAKLFLLMELRYAQHLKYNRIAWKLNDEEIPSVLNGQWTGASVRTILLNRAGHPLPQDEEHLRHGRQPRRRARAIRGHAAGTRRECKRTGAASGPQQVEGTGAMTKSCG
jgi:hypothetical protein